MPPACPVVNADSLVKRFGDRTAVAGVDLAVRPGICFGLLGPNGAGKTTTLRMLYGVTRPTAGSVSVFGLDIVNGVGSTEMGHLFLTNLPDAVEYGTSGVPVDGFKLRLVDENAQDVGDNEMGELLVKGESSAAGYWNQREKSRRTFMGEWTRTGTLRAPVFRGLREDVDAHDVVREEG